MPPPSVKVTKLIKYAKERNIELSQNDTELLKSAPMDSDLAKWMNRLDTSQPLTDEELQIWKHIQQTEPATARSISGRAEIVSDHNLTDTISSLETSTRRLEAQTDILTAQQALLSRHTQHAQQLRSKTASHIHSLEKKAATSAQHIHFSNESKLSELKDRLRRNLEQLDKESKSFPSVLTGRLNSDDRLLEHLQSHINSSSTHDFDPAAEAERIELLCKALQRAKVDELKDKLDRVFLENLRADVSPDDQSQDDKHADATASLITNIQQDVQSLYDEIDDVAAMLVDHEHRSSLRAHLGEIERLQVDQKNEALLETVERIMTMASILEAMTAKIQANGSRRHVLSRMLWHLDSVEKDMKSTTPSHKSIPAERQSNQRAITELMKGLALEPAQTPPRLKAEGTSAAMDAAGDNDPPSHEAFVETLQVAAQRRKQAVDTLLDATESATDVESELETLDGRIARAKSAFEEASS